MALDSSSTLSDVLAQYNDNLSWEGDVTKAQNCLAAIRWLLVNRPSRMGDEIQQIDYESLAGEKNLLEQYVDAHGVSVGRCAFTEGRMLL